MSRPKWLSFLVPAESPLAGRLEALFGTNANAGEDRRFADLLERVEQIAAGGHPVLHSPGVLTAYLDTLPAPTLARDSTESLFAAVGLAGDLLPPAAELPPVTLSPDAPGEDERAIPDPLSGLVTESLFAPATGEPPAPQPLLGEPETARAAIVINGGALAAALSGTLSPLGPVTRAADAPVYPAGAPAYVVRYSEGHSGGYVIDAANRTLLQGGPGDYPEIGQSRDDLLLLSGDHSAGGPLQLDLQGIDGLVLKAGDSFNLTASDDVVEAGRTLAVDAAGLGAGDHVLFDGSGETDGRFFFYGGGDTDLFLGGAGNDRILGGAGADLLSGGAGADIFVYRGAADSTGADYDVIGDFDAAVDKIDLAGTVSGFAAAVTAGSLSQGSFAADLAAAAGGLGASQAMWFAPDAGDLAGDIFLVVDRNGIAGYQDGEDLVIAIGGAPLADLSGQTGFFI